MMAVIEVIKVVGAGVGVLFGLAALAVINDLWLQWILTPEEYEQMLDSHDDFYGY